MTAWISTGAAPQIAVRRLALALAGIAVVATGIRYDKQRDLAAYVEEYAAAASVLGPDRVLLPVAVSPHGPRDENGRNLGYRVKPLLHATGWIVAQNGGVDLKNSQALTDHCPVRFPDGNNPFLLIAGSPGAWRGSHPASTCARRGAPRSTTCLYGATPGGARVTVRRAHRRGPPGAVRAGVPLVADGHARGLAALAGAARGAPGNGQAPDGGRRGPRVNCGRVKSYFFAGAAAAGAAR